MPLNPAARSAIEELKSSGVTDLTPDEIVLLNECGQRLVSCGDGADGISLSLPVEVGGIVLHPPTLCATDFIAAHTDGTLSNRNIWAVVFALVHAREPDALEAIVTEKALRGECKALRHRCHATLEEVWNAVADVLGGGSDLDMETRAMVAASTLCAWLDDRNKALAEFIRERTADIFGTEERKRNASAKPWRDVLYWKKCAATLGVMTGVSPDYWYAQDRRLFLKCYADAQRLSLAHGGMFAGSSRKSVPQEVVDAIREMERVKAEIIAKRKERGNGVQ